MKLKMLIVVLCFLSFSSLAKKQTTVGCFSSGEINLKFTEVLYDNVFLGYVVYNGKSKFIPLAFIKKTEITFDDRPSEFTYTWSEVVDGKINGLYVVASQGARFTSFYYKSNNGRVTEFEEKIEAYNNDGSDCIW
ncbi:TPA: hypothetical protein OPR14_004245 [Citrobacter koseri]|nr:hypothetical protein [Citrobacter koseri]